MAALQTKGLQDLVLCPGSRSGPLSIASGSLAKANLLRLCTAIDERSAAFFALGMSAFRGVASAVITTSGTAVANLLPAAVEADRSCQPLLLITADRPQRLKNCGANQTVNQEDFLKSVCRGFYQGPVEGLHTCGDEALEQLVAKAWSTAHVNAGPVHLNLPFEEPLYADQLEQSKLLSEWEPQLQKRAVFFSGSKKSLLLDKSPPPYLDPSLPGLIVAGPWRGYKSDLDGFQNSIRKWQSISGWPIFADPLSGVPFDQPGLIHSWDLLLSSSLPLPSESLQVLRLGPLPASRNLEIWLKQIKGRQLVVSEGDVRQLDPLHCSLQWDGGLTQWVNQYKKYKPKFDRALGGNSLFLKWFEIDQCAQSWLNHQLPMKGPVTEPALARWLPRILPEGLPVMLSASSPVRDWIKYVGDGALNRDCFAFRGASGIDGTLSLAMGLSMQSQTFLVCGDLALLHDTNGWLLANPKKPPLVVLLIDNGGGGIFEQIGLNTDSSEDFDLLFAMPQLVDPLAIADANRVPYRQVACLEDLNDAIEWSLALKRTVLLRVCTDRLQDALLRKSITEELSNHLSTI